LPYMIDLSIFANIIDPDLSDHIQRVGVTFYTRDDAQCKIVKEEKAWLTTKPVRT